MDTLHAELFVALHQEAGKAKLLRTTVHFNKSVKPITVRNAIL